MRLYGLGDYILKQWQSLFKKDYDRDMAALVKGQIWTLWIGLANVVVNLGFTVYLIWQTATNPAMTLGSMFMYMGAMSGFAGAAVSMASGCTSLYENNLYIGHLFDFLSRKPAITVLPNPVPVPTPIQRGIVFEGVAFRYPTSERDVLRNLKICTSFRVRPWPSWERTAPARAR